MLSASALAWTTAGHAHSGVLIVTAIENFKFSIVHVRAWSVVTTLYTTAASASQGVSLREICESENRMM